MQNPLFEPRPQTSLEQSLSLLHQRPVPRPIFEPQFQEWLGAGLQGRTVTQVRRDRPDSIESVVPKYFAGLDAGTLKRIKSYLYVAQKDSRTGAKRKPSDPGEGGFWTVPKESVAEALTALKRGELERLDDTVKAFKSLRSEARRQSVEPKRSVGLRSSMLAEAKAAGITDDERQVVEGFMRAYPGKFKTFDEAVATRRKSVKEEAVPLGERARQAAEETQESVAAPLRPIAQAQSAMNPVARFVPDIIGGIAATPSRILEAVEFLADPEYRQYVNPQGTSFKDYVGAVTNLVLDAGLIDPVDVVKLGAKGYRTMAMKIAKSSPEAAQAVAQTVKASDAQIEEALREVTLQDVKRKARAEAKRLPEQPGQRIDIVQAARARQARVDRPYTDAEWRDVTESAIPELRKVGKQARANALQRSLRTGRPDAEIDSLLREEMTQKVSRETPIGGTSAEQVAETSKLYEDVPPFAREGEQAVPTDESVQGVREGGLQEAGPQGAVESPLTEPQVPGPTAQAGAATEPIAPRRVSDVLSEASESLEARAAKIRERMAARPSGAIRGKQAGAFNASILEDFVDAVELGAVHLAKSGTDFAAWSARMVEDFGDAIKPHLSAIYDRIVSGADDVEQSAKEAMAAANKVPSVSAAPDERLRLSDLEKIASDAGISLDGLRARKTLQSVAEETAGAFDAYADSVKSLSKTDLAPNQSITANQRLAGHVLAKQTAQEVSALESALKAAQDAGDAEGALRASSAMASKEEELAKVVRLLYKTGSADGFNLAMHRYRLSDYDAAADMVRLERLSKGTATAEERRILTSLTEQAKTLRDKIRQLQKSDPAIPKMQRTVADLDAKRARLLADAEKPTLLDELTMWRQASLLTNPRTIIRNFVGNAVNAIRDEGLRSADWLADQVVRAVAPNATQGRRTVKAFVPGGVKKWGQTFEKSVEDVRSVLKSGITPEEAARLDVRKESRFFLTKYALRFQGIQDKPWYDRAFVQSLWEQASLIKGTDDVAELLPLVQKPTDAMQVQAMKEAELSVFAEPNVVAEAVNKIGHDSPLARFLVKTVVPFVKVPSNIGKRILKSNLAGTAYDVAGAVSKVKSRGRAGEAAVLTPFEQKQLAKSITDGTLGTGLLWYGYFLASEGKATGKSPQSAKERETMYLTGRQPSDVQIGGVSLRTAGTSPLFSLVTLGAAVHDYQEQEAERFQKESERYEKLKKQGVPESELTVPEEPKSVGPKEIVQAGKDVLLEFPFLKGIKDVVGETSDAANYLSGLAASFVPGLPGDVRQTVAFDPKMRDPRARRESLLQLRDQVYMKLGMRERVLPRVDPLGRPSPQSRPFDVFGTKGMEDDPVVRLIADTGLKLDVEKRTDVAKGLTPDQLLERQIETGQKIYDALAKDEAKYREYAEKHGAESLQRLVDAQVSDIRKGDSPRPIRPPDRRTGGVQPRRERRYSEFSFQ